MDRDHSEGMTSQDHEGQEWQTGELTLAVLALLCMMGVLGCMAYGASNLHPLGGGLPGGF
jgi:hypothetical protein